MFFTRQLSQHIYQPLLKPFSSFSTVFIFSQIYRTVKWIESLIFKAESEKLGETILEPDLIKKYWRKGVIITCLSGKILLDT